MKVRVTLKDPASMHDAVEEAIRKDIKASYPTLSKKEQETLLDDRAEDVQAIISKHWMQYGEYLTVDFDTEALTATVVPNKDAER